MAAVRVRIDQGALHALLRSPSGPVGRDMLRRGYRVHAAASRLVKVDSGRLRSSLSVELVQRRGAPAAKIGSKVNHARVHHQGHGVIVPKKPGGVLVFRPKGSRTFVFAKRVRAVAGNPYLTRALPAARG